MRKLLCGLLVVSAVVAFPAAVSAAGCYDMLYGNELWGISEACTGGVYIHVNGRQIHVYSRTRSYPPYPPRPRDIMLTFALRRTALAVGVTVLLSVIASLVLKQQKRKRGQQPSSVPDLIHAQS